MQLSRKDEFASARQVLLLEVLDVATEAAPKPGLGCGSQCECSVGLGGCGCGCGCGVGVGVVWVVGVGAQGYVIDARRLARQQFRLGRQLLCVAQCAECQGMLPRTEPRPSALFLV